MDMKNKTVKSLAIASALIIGMPNLVSAHEEISAQEGTTQRPVSPSGVIGNQDGSTGQVDTVRARNPNQSPSPSRDSGITDRSNQGISNDRNGRAVDHPSRDWGVDRADEHGGGH